MASILSFVSSSAHPLEMTNSALTSITELLSENFKKRVVHFKFRVVKLINHGFRQLFAKI
jgi:hypothetical protein